ncbi:hypothetical protein [uncultured Thiohalocapsa sp.]|uniref:hypothetical protein n=1 Tax=uncultured Thiohalocapsa sp. TaxID=768990 RepID=UPI0025F2E334|nr:hypothetical protein [uncultured Thiohalocapsa sp.]
MDPAVTTIVAASLPYLDALLGGSREHLKQLGKDLTGEVIDRVHGFWQRLVQEAPGAKALARAGEDPDQRLALETLVGEVVERHPQLGQELAALAPLLRPVAQVANQSGGTTQVTGAGGINVAGDVHGDITLNNRFGD